MKRNFLKKMQCSLVALGTASCLLWAMPAMAQPVTNGFTLEKEAKPQEYNRMIFGQFIEHFHRQVYGGIFEPGSPLSDKDGFRKDVIEALRELKIPIVRWPGGCFVSSYHWLDAVGPDRQPTYDKSWGVEDPNTFGTVEFVQWCRLIGAEPFICTNAGTGTAEEMSDWVEYCNLNIGKFGRLRKSHGIEEPLNVKYWSIGNENYMQGELGYKSPAELAPFVKESAKLMKAADANIVLFAGGAHYDENVTVPLLQQAGRWLSYISVHGYYGGPKNTYMDIMMMPEIPEGEIARILAMLDKTKLRGSVKIAFDEWNTRGWHTPGHGANGSANKDQILDRDKNDINSVCTMADAVFSACFLNLCLRNCNDVEIGGFSPVVNVRGALFVHPKGIVKRTTFHVLKLYANELEKNILQISLTAERLIHGDLSSPALDAIVTCNDAKTHFVIAVVNKSPDKTIDFAPDFASLTGSTPKQISAVRLSGKSTEDYNDIGAENRVVPEEITLKVKDKTVSLPPHSLTFLRIVNNE
jgi:alpha-N-arabinofuranosidase